MYRRLQLLTGSLAVLRGPLIGQIIHVVFRQILEKFDETRTGYTYAVPLNLTAVVSGITIGALLALLIESLLFGVIRMARPRRRRPAAGPLNH